MLTSDQPIQLRRGPGDLGSARSGVILYTLRRGQAGSARWWVILAPSVWALSRRDIPVEVNLKLRRYPDIFGQPEHQWKAW
jgi:hypothetical protein